MKPSQSVPPHAALYRFEMIPEPATAIFHHEQRQYIDFLVRQHTVSVCRGWADCKTLLHSSHFISCAQHPLAFRPFRDLRGLPLTWTLKMKTVAVRRPLAFCLQRTAICERTTGR